MKVKKKIIIALVYVLILCIIINILHVLFYKEYMGLLQYCKSFSDEINLKTEYYSRKIIKSTLDYSNYSQEKNVMSTDQISINLSNINYDQNSGILKMKFIFYMNDGQCLESVRFKLKIYDKKYLFYENQIGSIYYMDNLDYLFYNEDLYNKIANKKLDTSKLNQNSKCNKFKEDIYQILEVELNVGQNYKIQDSLHIEFLNLIYNPLGDFYYKAIEPLGEIKYIINF